MCVCVCVCVCVRVCVCVCARVRAIDAIFQAIYEGGVERNEWDVYGSVRSYGGGLLFFQHCILFINLGVYLIKQSGFSFDAVVPWR